MFHMFQSYVAASVFMLQVLHSCFKRILLDRMAGSVAHIHRRGWERTGLAREADVGAAGLHVHAREKRRRARVVPACMRACETEQARVAPEDTRGCVRRGHAIGVTRGSVWTFGP
jgi:hypothetical protein